MKLKQIGKLLLLALLGWNGLAYGEEIKLDIKVPEPRLWVDAQGFSHVEINGYSNEGEPGNPSLPSRTFLVALPPGELLSAVNIKSTETHTLSGTHLVFPVQRQFPFSYQGPKPFTGPNLAIYQSPSLFPVSRVKTSSIQFKHGFGLLPLLFMPVQIEPLTGSVTYVSSITVTVNTTPKTIPHTLSAPVIRGLKKDFSSTARLVENPQILRAYSAPTILSQSQDSQYLIITNEALAQCAGDNTLASLSADKNLRGISTSIETMETIRASYSGRDDAEKVRNCIKDHYQNSGTEYVLLAGDADIQVVGGETEPVLVPIRGLWGNIDYGGPELNLLSDLYYACLDGDFDADGDSVFGEEHDDPDLLSEVAVGRAPVDNCQEVANFVRKTLLYQNSLSDNLKNVWLAGEQLAPDQYSSAILEKIRTGSYEDIPTLGFSESTFFNINTLYDPIADQTNWDKDQMLAVINGGVHILNHCGHSMTTYNLRLTCDEIDQGLENPEPFFEYSLGCYPGSIDNRLDPVFSSNEVSAQDSFAEHLVLGEHGAFAAILFTRFGVGDLLMRTFWDAAFRRGINQLGEMHAYSREVVIPWIDDRDVRWQVYSINLFGDPEVALHMSNSSLPVMGLPQTPLFFYTAPGLGNPAPQTITVRNDGQGALNWTLVSSQPWLKASPTSGLAPTDVEISIDISGLEPGYYEGELGFSSDDAGNSPQLVPVALYIIKIPDLEVPHNPIPPILDGEISKDEYEPGAFLDIGHVAPGYSVAHLVHDNQKLYISLSLYDDQSESPEDYIALVFDNNNDDSWPTAPGDEGVFMFYGNGDTYFMPFYNDGGFAKRGEYEKAPPGIEFQFGMNQGMRVVELSVDWVESHLKIEPGNSLGFMLLYYDGDQGNYQMVGGWPQAVPEMDTCRYFGNLQLGLEADMIRSEPKSLEFSGTAGGKPTEQKSLKLEVSTENQLSVEIGSPDPWILFSVDRGTTPWEVKIQADPSALAQGSYSGKVLVVAPGAKNSPLTVPVSFEVVDAPPVFDIQPASLEFEMMEGGEKPEPLSFSIGNQGGGELNWTAISGGAWFGLSSTGGASPSSVEVTVIGEALPAGSYSGIVLFTAPLATPAQLPLTLEVLPQDPVIPPDPEDQPCGCASTSNQATGWGLNLSILMALALIAHRRRP